MGSGRLRGFSLLAMLVLLGSGCDREFTVSVAPFEIEVVDEKGHPVEDALVLVSYRTSYGAHEVVDGVLHAVEARTDASGTARFEGWEKKTVRGFGPHDPTIMVSRFGHMTALDLSKSERKKREGTFYVSGIRSVVGNPIVLKPCRDEKENLDNECLRESYSRMFVGLGPIQKTVMEELIGYREERDRHENYLENDP